MTVVLLTVSRNFKVCMQPDVYEPNWFKLGMKIHTTKVYSVILVSLTLTLIQDHSGESLFVGWLLNVPATG